MTTYRLTTRPKSSIVTMTFDYYNQAVAFCEASRALNPSKPFKKGALWHVSFLRPEIDLGHYEEVTDWQRPGVYFNGKVVYSTHGEWKGVEGLSHIGAEIPPKKPSAAVPEPLKHSPLRH